MKSLISPFCTVLAALLFLCSGLCKAGNDWPYWMGPHGTGVSDEVDLPDRWDPKEGEESHVFWVAEIGSRSTPTLMKDRIYLLTRSFEDEIQKTGERVVCLDAETGELLWDYSFNVYLSDVPLERIGSSSVVCDPVSGQVYAQGACGEFTCLNGETGTVVWKRSLQEEFGFHANQGGSTNSPIIFEDNVIISGVSSGWGDQAVTTHRVLALDKHNGIPTWSTTTSPVSPATRCSSPVIALIAGEQQMICAGGDGAIHSFQPRTGKPIWSCALSAGGIRSTPLISGNRVFCGHSDENLDGSEDLGTVVCLDPAKRGDITEDGTVWRKTEYSLGRSSPIEIEGRLYFVNDAARLFCLDAKDGHQIGEPIHLGTAMRANMLYADGKLYVNEVNGRGYILKPTPQGAEIIFKYRFPNGEECHGSPIAASGRLYIPTTGRLYCVGKEDHTGQPAPAPLIPEETPAALDEAPAVINVVPAEALLRPGMHQQFQVRLYNSKGQYLRNAKPEEMRFELNGPGAMEEEAIYTIPADFTEHVATTVTVFVNELEGTSRLRVVPDLNWSFDFDEGKLPVTWVRAGQHHVILDWNLLEALRKDEPVSGSLYLCLMRQFAQQNAAELVFDDSTPAQSWKELLTFLNLSERPARPRTVKEAKEKFDKALQRLVDEKVLASFEWSTWERKTGRGDEVVHEPRLSIVRGTREVDGNGVLCRIVDPESERHSMLWMGDTAHHDYTVQADLLCFSNDGRLPDTGLIAQRYLLKLLGPSQEVQLSTWSTMLNRFSAEAVQTWKPDVWYTMKLRAETAEDKATLKGKLWVRGEAEPSEWSLLEEDLAPNKTGSPGLCGTSQDGEIFYDNITVTRNPAE